MFLFEEEMLMLLPLMASGIPSAMFSIAMYVLTALALYTIAQRRGLNKPWLAWIPVFNCWILGSLSDQYQYVVKGENKSKRKVLLILNVLILALSAAMLAMGVVIAAGAILADTDAQIMSNIMAPTMGLLGLCVPMLGISLAAAVIRYMALYDIYRSVDPGNSVLFLVLSILFHVTEPFFLFFNREKDGGMPPRRQPEHAYQEPVQDYVYETPAEESESQAWEEKDYL